MIETYEVVVNHEEQHSLWPAGRELPPGWTRVGVSGDRETCLAWVGEHWTDLRPKSVRERLAAHANGSAG